jgi:RHS repeat-associated protein
MTLGNRVIAENRSGVYKEYVRDTLGSTIKLIGDTQSITDTFTYWPYGEVRVRTGTTATPLQFGGTMGYYTGLANMLYVRRRILLPAVARWSARDPLWPGQFPYSYANCSPATFVDPTGLTLTDPCMDVCQGLLGGGLLCCSSVCAAGTIVTLGGLSVPCAFMVAACVAAAGVGGNLACDYLCHTKWHGTPPPQVPTDPVGPEGPHLPGQPIYFPPPFHGGAPVYV